MKKLIAISLVLTLVAGAAFAEVTVGGQLGMGVTIISGDNGDDAILGVNSFTPELGAGNWGQGGGGRVDVTYTNDDGTFGGMVRVKPLNGFNTGTDRVFAWWQPLSQLKLTLGVDGNGQFGVNYIVGWSWHANDAEDFVAWHGYGFTRSAWSYSGFDTFGAVLTLTPIEGLAINVGIPYKASTEAADVYNHAIAQLMYNIAGVGEIGITYTSGAGYRNWVTTADPHYDWVDDDKNPATPPEWEAVTPKPTVAEPDPGAVRAQFYLTAVENLQLNIGLKYTFGGTIGEGAAETTYAPPITAGFGLNYTVSDTVGVKARLAAGFAGSTKVGDVTVTTDDYYNFKLGFDVMPYFDLSILKLFLNIGVTYDDAQKKGDNETKESALGWYVNPYITKSAGGGTFYAGFQLASNGVKYKVGTEDKGPDITWGIPIGIQIGF